ncbi:MAG: succinylglutamate-semialdehyde dehydrogenase [Clostridia bacterium]|nr:succinylglutamate-semialdehyde dehydrogenase [Clostridia bacterium]
MKSCNCTILESFNPSTGERIWDGKIATESEIDEIINKSKLSQIKWESTSLEERKRIILNFAQLVKENLDEAATIISQENGKPFWEAKTEVNSLVNKVQVVFDAYEERAKSKTKEMANGRISITRYRPHGVMVVLGPFNFPMSMPNSHVMPALYAGNSVIFKPSERTPKSAEYYLHLWRRAGLPDDVLQIVNGDFNVGRYLINSKEINGVLFIGSHKAGKAIEQDLIMQNKICALEMGGNSPLVIWDYSDVRAAINITIQSTFISSGQRCSAARRLIVNSSIYDSFIPALCRAINEIVVGDAFQNNPTPFMGPMIDKKAVGGFMEQYNALIQQGATVLVETKILKELGENFVKPALVDVSGREVKDEEIFGPLLQVYRAENFEQAISIANNTQYGLAAGIVTENDDIYDEFFKKIRAGIVNRNQPLTGSTTIAPFGGMKASGNNRSAGYLSVDYCVYPCASIESNTASVPTTLAAGLKF